MRAVRLAGAFVDAARPRGPAAAAEIVQCDDVETIGINRLARADAVVPPAGFAIVRVMDASGVMITGQRVADQDCIRAFSIERAVGLDHQFMTGQRSTAM